MNAFHPLYTTVRMLHSIRVFSRRFIYKGDTSTHAEGTDPRGGLSERGSGVSLYKILPSTIVYGIWH